MKIAITGASGFIGRRLMKLLAARGHRLRVLSRHAGTNLPAGVELSVWDPLLGLAPEAALRDADAVLHLAGEPVAQRWTAAAKQRIYDSRVIGTRHLVSALENCSPRPPALVCASAIGLYGSRGDELLREESPAGQGFLAEVCREWEDASRIAAEAGIRTVNIRIGLVLSAKGGALANMLMPFKLGLGGRIGSGQQWWSWIHVDDIVGGIHHAMRTESLSGPVNLVAPNPVRNAEFTKVLASVLGRPAFFPVPEFALRLAFGKTAAEELLLASQRVEPGKLGASGYTFRFRELRQALENLVG